MTELVGFILLQALLAFAGVGVLRGLGLVAPGWRALLPAAGAVLLTGTAAVVVILIALLVIAVPFTVTTIVLVCVAVAGAGFGAARLPRERTASAEERSAGVYPTPTAWLARFGVAAFALWVALGFYVFARAPIRNDDARIWSLKGLTLTYYSRLRPEIFANPLTGLAHPVYPIFQPVLEAALGRITGHQELALFHSELWLLLAASLSTLAYLIWWRSSRPVREQAGILLLALTAVIPAVISNVWAGFADVTGAVLLGCGTVAVGLWIDRRQSAVLWLGALLLAAAANTKDEDAIGAALVLLGAGVIVIARRDWRGGRLWLGGAALAVVFSLPWRVWTAAHHLSDKVQPPLPRALSPAFISDRLPELRETAAAMLSQTMSGWKLLAAIFIVVCLFSVANRASRMLASFYLLSFALLVAAMLWIYTTTPESLAFLIPTSMNRTVMVFMALTPLASAHLLSRMRSPEDDSRDR